MGAVACVPTRAPRWACAHACAQEVAQGPADLILGLVRRRPLLQGQSSAGGGRRSSGKGRWWHGPGAGREGRQQRRHRRPQRAARSGRQKRPPAQQRLASSTVHHDVAECARPRASRPHACNDDGAAMWGPGGVGPTQQSAGALLNPEGEVVGVRGQGLAAHSNVSASILSCCLPMLGVRPPFMAGSTPALPSGWAPGQQLAPARMMPLSTSLPAIWHWPPKLAQHVYPLRFRAKNWPWQQQPAANAPVRGPGEHRKPACASIAVVLSVTREQGGRRAFNSRPRSGRARRWPRAAIDTNWWVAWVCRLALRGRRHGATGLPA